LKHLFDGTNASESQCVGGACQVIGFIYTTRLADMALVPPSPGPPADDKQTEACAFVLLYAKCHVILQF
jgi:hypothetical protein